MPYDPENPPDKLNKLPAKKQRQWVGSVLGNVTVLEQVIGKSGRPVKVYKCRCTCGTVRTFEEFQLSGVRSCGCKMNVKPKCKDITGHTFGRWTVIGPALRTNYWKCECECGNTSEVFRGSLTSGKSVSCGCWKKDGDWIKTGIDHHSFNPELTDEDRRNQKTHWGFSNRLTQAVFKRDNYTCSVCGKRGVDLASHHKDGWNWCVDGRHDAENLVTLCVECHKAFHMKYGHGDNTAAQYEEFRGTLCHTM